MSRETRLLQAPAGDATPPAPMASKAAAADLEPTQVAVLWAHQAKPLRAAAHVLILQSEHRSILR